MQHFIHLIRSCAVAILFLLAATSYTYAQGVTEENIVSEAQLVQAADAPTEIEIVGGQQAQVGEFPWQAWFTYRGSDGNTYSCGGSLIHRQWVLTAAHCIGRMGTVILGAHNINRSSENGRQEIAIEQIIVHPRYGQNNLDSDIALLKLRQPATLNSRVAVVPLIAASGQGNLVSAGTTSTISGWGTTRPNRTQPASVLLKARVPLVSNHTCELAHGSSIVTNNMLCETVPVVGSKQGLSVGAVNSVPNATAMGSILGSLGISIGSVNMYPSLLHQRQHLSAATAMRMIILLAERQRSPPMATVKPTTFT